MTSISPLDRFIRQYMYMATVRGLTPSNPVNFLFTPDRSKPNDQYRMIVSYTEPSFSDVPYNVLWLDVNPGSPTYKNILLRVSHISDGTYRSSWKAITAYENIFNSEQYFRFVVENAGDLGIDVGELAVPKANTKSMGIVLLDPSNPEADNVDALVVSDSDPRMTDARIPNDHEHDDYPRTMIRVNDSAYVEVSASNMPEEGYILAIVASDPNDNNRFIGKWVKPTADHVEWTTARLLALSIRIPGDANYMQDNSSIDLIGIAEYENDVVTDPEGLEWSISDNEYGITVHPDTGVVTAPDVPHDVTVQVTVRKKDPVYGQWVTATIPLRIKNAYVPEDDIIRIELTGPTSLHYKQRGAYSVVAVYSSGKRIVVTPDELVSSSDKLTLINQTGVAGNTPVDVKVTLTATYTPKGGTPLSADLDVTILAQVITKFLLSGPSTVDEDNSVLLTSTVTWSNGDVEDVEPTSLSADPASAVTLTGLSVYAKEVEADTLVTFTATYMADELMRSVHELTIKNIVVPPKPIALHIKGPNAMDENTSASFTFEVEFDDTSTKQVTLNPGDFTSNHAAATVVSSTVTAGEVDADVSVTLSAVYVEDGKTLNATHALTIRDVAVPVVLESIEIVGATTMPENDNRTFTVAAHFSDGDTQVITPDEFKIISGSEFGELTSMSLDSLEVTKDEVVTLSATHTIKGVTKTDTHRVTITDVYVPPVLESLEISGPSTVRENTTATYVVRAVYDNGDKTPVTPATFTSSNTAAATLAGLQLTAKEVDGDQTTTLSATYVEDGKEVSATLDVVIQDIVIVVTLESITIRGANEITEGQDADYLVDANYSDGSTVQVTPKTFVIHSGASHATLTGQNLVANMVDADQTVVLRATYEEDGVTKTDDHSVKIKNVPPTIDSLIIEGATEMDEQSTLQLAAKYRMSDGSKVTANVTWSIIQGSSYATINQSGLVTSNTVTQDQNILVRISDTDGRFAQHSVKINNSINIVPQSVSIRGVVELQEGRTHQFSGQVRMSNNTTRALTDSEITSWNIKSGAAAGSITSRGLFTAKEVDADTNVVTTMTATVDGLDFDAEYTTKVTNVVDEPTGAEISGDTVVEESSEAQYAVLIRLTSGKTAAPESVTNWASSSPLATVSGSGKATFGNVTAATTVTLSCTATYRGKTYNPELAVRINNTANNVISQQLIGANEITEGEHSDYLMRVEYEDGTSDDITAITITTNSNAATANGRRVTASFVDADTVVKLTAKATVLGKQITATKNITVKDIPVVPDRLVINGGTEVEGGSTINLTAKLIMSDNSDSNVTDAASWTISSTGGLSGVSVSKGVVTTPSVNTDTNITVRAAHQGKNDTHVVKVKAAVAPGGGPRFGIVSKVTSLAGFNQAFLDSLTTDLTSEGEQFVTLPAGSSTMANNKFGYTCWPKSLGYGYFRDYSSGSYGFAGSWDGALEFDDFNFSGPAEVTIGGVEYYIYRNDFPFEGNMYKFSVLYGSRNPLSGTP